MKIATLIHAGGFVNIIGFRRNKVAFILDEISFLLFGKALSSYQIRKKMCMQSPWGGLLIHEGLWHWYTSGMVN